MRRVLIASLIAGLAIAPAALAQERTQTPPPEDAPPREAAPPPASEPAVGPPEDRLPADPAPPPLPPGVTPGGPLHPGDENLPPDAHKGEAPPAKPKPKLGEAAGGLAGGIAGQVAGTAVAGPLGGIAASFVGDKLGSGAVRVGKKVFGRGKKPAEAPVEQARAEQPGAEQAAAAPQAATPVAATEPPPEPIRPRAEPLPDRDLAPPAERPVPVERETEPQTETPS
jgi:hypothetical protein